MCKKASSQRQAIAAAYLTKDKMMCVLCIRGKLTNRDRHPTASDTLFPVHVDGVGQMLRPLMQIP